MKSRGFSLIELIVVIIVLGIMAVTVMPKMITNDDLQSNEIRDQMLSGLRLVQLSSMHNTNANDLFKLCIRESQEESQVVAAQISDCSAFNDDSDNSVLSEAFLVIPIPSTIDITITADTDNEASLTEVTFDSFGRPSFLPEPALEHPLGYKIAVGDAALCLSNEGGIYACE